MNLNSKIYIAGHGGLVGSSVFKLLLSKGFSNIITKSSKELDLRDQVAVNRFFEKVSPDYVFLFAARAGGTNDQLKYPADFLIDNLMIETNLIKASYAFKVKKLLFLGSSFVYPKYAEQPFKEETLLSGYLEPISQAYALSKIVGIQLCNDYRKQYGLDFISLVPSNVYGCGDKFSSISSHVIPALIERFYTAKLNNIKKVVIWGTGRQLREFLYVDDLAEACLFMMVNYSEIGHINIGSGEEYSINDLALIISKIIGYEGKIEFDLTKPDGHHRRLIDVEKATKLGWKSKVSLLEGIQKTYECYLIHLNEIRKSL